MSDRELLELAAKAEGHGVEFDNLSGLTFMNTKIEGLLWNPLHNDGDALRLAVALRLLPRQGVNLVSVLRPDGGWDDENYRDHNGDSYAATRRAIVRAAAEIGKGMP